MCLIRLGRRGDRLLRRGPPHDAGDGVGVGFVERFALEQCLGEVLELLAVLGEGALGFLGALGENPSHLLVDQLERALRRRAGFR